MFYAPKKKALPKFETKKLHTVVETTLTSSETKNFVNN